MSQENQEVPTNIVFNRGVKFTPSASSETLLGLKDKAGEPVTITRRKFAAKSGVDFDTNTTVSGEEFGFSSDPNEPVFGNDDENSSDDGKPQFLKRHKSKRKIEKIPDDYEEKIIFKYLILNLVYVVFGFVTLIIVMVLHLLESGMKEFLVVNHKQTLIPPALMYLSTIISILLGMGAIIAFLLNADLYYKMYERVLWSIFGLNLASIIISFGSWKLFNVTVYQRIFEAETTFVRTRDRTYLNVFKNVDHGFWDKLQSHLKCCGMHGPLDWLHLAGDFVESCCHSTHMAACKTALKEWRKNKNTTDIQTVLDNIYQKDCAFVLGLEVKNLQRDWVLFPTIFAFFNFLLMLQGNFLNRKIRSFYESVAGVESIIIFQNQFFSKCLLKYRNMKKPRWLHDLRVKSKEKPKAKPKKAADIDTPHSDDRNPDDPNPGDTQPNEQSGPETKNQKSPENRATQSLPELQRQSGTMKQQKSDLEKQPERRSEPILKSRPEIKPKTENEKSPENTPETETQPKPRSQSETVNKEKSGLEKQPVRRSEPIVKGQKAVVKKSTPEQIEMKEFQKSEKQAGPSGSSKKPDSNEPKEEEGPPDQTPGANIATIITKTMDESR